MVVLINKFTLKGSVEDFRSALDNVSAFMQAQPGFIRHQLYQSVNNPDIFVETAHWSDAESHKSAVQSEEFRSRVKAIGAVATPDVDLYNEVEDD